MQNSRLAVIAALAMTCLAAPRAVEAQNPQTRDGFWIQFGMGWGSLGCNDCDSREGGLSGALSLGGTLSERWLLGGGTNGWTKSQDGARLTVSTVTALVRFYPSLTSGFFLHGGLGYGRVEVSASGSGFSISASENGAGAMLGLGWDIRVGRNLSITPFWSGFAMSSDNLDANVGQLGVGLTIH